MKCRTLQWGRAIYSVEGREWSVPLATCRSVPSTPWNSTSPSTPPSRSVPNTLWDPLQPLSFPLPSSWKRVITRSKPIVFVDNEHVPWWGDDSGQWVSERLRRQSLQWSRHLVTHLEENHTTNPNHTPAVSHKEIYDRLNGQVTTVVKGRIVDTPCNGHDCTSRALPKTLHWKIVQKWFELVSFRFQPLGFVRHRSSTHIRMYIRQYHIKPSSF